MIGQAVGRVASAAAPYILDAAGNIIQNATGPRYNTDQTDTSLRTNDTWASGRSRQQLADESAAYNQRADADQRRAFDAGRFAGAEANQASNSNAARAMALNAQAALNNQYMSAGDRLNQAAANSQQALNQAMSTIASVFR